MSKKSSSPYSHGSSSTTSTPRTGRRGIKLGLDGSILCDHDVGAMRQIAGPRSTRCGEEFFGCPYWKTTSDCGFFMWKEDLNEVIRVKEEEMSIAKMKLEIERLKEENLKLSNQLSKVQAKKSKLEEEVRGLKLKIYEAAKLESKAKVVFFFLALVVIGWIVKG